MTTKRFNNLSIPSIHKELTDSVNLVDIGNEFASNYDECRMNFDKFIAVICYDFLKFWLSNVYCESKLLILYYWDCFY